MTDQVRQFAEATLGGGCFWCIEAVFKEMDGVIDVESGYAGGARPNPTYAQVCSGATGHAEVVRVRFDPERVDYREILALFFIAHDPTQLNRQGHDVGSQYRSVIFHHDETQARIARETIAELDASGRFSQRIVTEVAPVTTYYPAEAGHQDYFEQYPDQPYCQVVVAPKLHKARQWLARKG